jgi:sialic acid synthase SpsE
VRYGPTEAEQGSMTFRRSLYIARDMQAGEVLTRDNLRCVRPGYGLAPKYFESLLGKRVNQALKKGTPIRWELVG